MLGIRLGLTIFRYRRLLVNTLNWYGIARRRNKGWSVQYTSDAFANWMRTFCEVQGPFPIRDIARLACGQRLSREHLLSRLHGDDLQWWLQQYGMDEWRAWQLARKVDERAADVVAVAK